MRKLAICLILFFSAGVARSGDTDDLLSLLVMAKGTGMCGVFSQMARFQESTKMEGGDEFVVRFISTEAARLGHTLESFLAQCADTTKEYNRIYAAAESGQND